TGQLFLIFVYLALNFLLVFCGTDNDIDWMAHHSAKLTYANLPLIIGLAGKNNVISRLTGFAYESLNVLHRWSARFVILSSAIHIGGRIHVNVPSSDPGPGRRYIAWGWAAFALFIYMIIMASRSFRNRYYQFFLVQHVACWFIVIACLVIHRPQEQGWIWAGFALHGLDRIGRGMRILYYHAIKKTVKSEENPQGTVTALSTDTIRVSIRTRQNWIPGQHVFLHCPNESLGGHPFTVSNISRPLEQGNNNRPFESQQELLIRVRGGLTKHLFETASGSHDDETAVDGKGFPREPVPIRAWTEGPCGCLLPGVDHNTLVLVAGGSGVSYTLSNSLDIVRRARAMHMGSDSKRLSIATKRLHFLWMVKKPEQVEWIGDHLRGMALAAPPGLLNITIFITGKRQANEPSVLEGFVEHGSTVVLRSGRPDFKEIVANEVKETAYDDWIAIGACGPTPMNDSLADAVSEAVKPMQVLRGEVRRNI
ncbi:hypothetical protein BDY24DRAFT_342513, partial [Mrakia frigida]|uniref:ferric reductase family protein n=1 Tax=Mrakia frigida TaxID=29902 RepID=UPI003FCC18E6